MRKIHRSRAQHLTTTLLRLRLRCPLPLTATPELCSAVQPSECSSCARSICTEVFLPCLWCSSSGTRSSLFRPCATEAHTHAPAEVLRVSFLGGRARVQHASCKQASRERAAAAAADRGRRSWCRSLRPRSSRTCRPRWPRPGFSPQRRASGRFLLSPGVYTIYEDKSQRCIHRGDAQSRHTISRSLVSERSASSEVVVRTALHGACDMVLVEPRQVGELLMQLCLQHVVIVPAQLRFLLLQSIV